MGEKAAETSDQNTTCPETTSVHFTSHQWYSSGGVKQKVKTEVFAGQHRRFFCLQWRGQCMVNKTLVFRQCDKTIRTDFKLKNLNSCSTSFFHFFQLWHCFVRLVTSGIFTVSLVTTKLSPNIKSPAVQAVHLAAESIWIYSFI